MAGNGTGWIAAVGIIVAILFVVGIGLWWYFRNRRDISVTINESNVTVEKGKTFRFTANVVETSAKEIDQSVTWSVDDSSKASIGANTGLLTALSDSGTVKVTATSVNDPSKSDTKTVTLTPEIINYRVQNQVITDTQPLYSKNGNYYATVNPSTGQLCVKMRDGSSKWCDASIDTRTPPSNQHFAVIQEDGNLCGYRGTSLNDPPTVRGSGRCNGKTAPAGQTNNYVIMQDDGKLCTYTGTPAAPQANLWCSNGTMR